jgi:zinc transport system substrate-binding protein
MALSLRYSSLILALTLIGCSDTETTSIPTEERLTLYAVNYPLAYFAQRIAGEAVEVVFPKMDGDPAFWQPSPEDLAGFQSADLILLNGAGYAKWLNYVSLPQSRMVDTSSGFKDRYIKIEDALSHSHSGGEAHSHGVAAFTTWLDPTLAIEQAAAIDAALSLKQSGFEQLKSELLALDKSLKTAFARLSGQALIGSHPVYQYLKQQYDLDLRSLHWEPDVMPADEMWQELAELRTTHPSSILLWEGEPLPEIKARLSALGIQSVVFDPCGNRPGKGDFLSVMQANVNNIESLNLD